MGDRPVVTVVAAYVFWTLRWRNQLKPFVNDRSRLAGAVGCAWLYLEALAVIAAVCVFGR